MNNLRVQGGYIFNVSLHLKGSVLGSLWGFEVEGLTRVAASQSVHPHEQPKRAGGLHLQCDVCYRMPVVRTLQGGGLKGGSMGVLANLCKVFHKGKAQHIM